jgi:hypothetical protein
MGDHPFNLLKHTWVWWNTSKFSALGRLRKKGLDFKASLDYTG